TSGKARLSHIELRLVGDVADDTGLGARAEESPLRPLEHLDTLQIRRVHIEVSARQLTRLLVQIDGHVREAADRASRLSRHAPGAQAPHEDLVLARSRGRCGHVGQIAQQIVEARYVQFLERVPGECLDRDWYVL